MTPWLSVVGIGEDGLDAISPAARALVAAAATLIGGDRHLAMIPPDGRPRLAWGDNLRQAVGRIEALRGTPVCVLASGDPFDYGIASALARRFAADEMTVVPAPGAFALACARLRWSRPEVETLTLHGRPLALLDLHLRPGARLLILSEDGDTPLAVARHLSERGFGPSPMTVFEHMAGNLERRRDGTAESWDDARVADLNTIALECIAAPGARIVPRVAGLADALYEHDGQLTKREIRAATIAALMPLPGQMLWDVGAGCGSIAIEWLRAEPTAQAVAIERHAGRRAMIAHNALTFGVPRLAVVDGVVPAALAGLPSPDAVFVGGAVAAPGVLEACWTALPPGGRLVANSVSLEAEARLIAFQQEHGGNLLRFAISHADSIGRMTVMRPAMPVFQYVGMKP